MDKILFIIPPYVNFDSFVNPAFNERTVVKKSGNYGSVVTDMYDICVKNNYIKGDYLKCDFKRAIIETEDFTAEYIQEKGYSMNLELNFVNNSDFRLGNFETALKGFENTIRIRNDHALAYYFASKCCKMMNLDEKCQAYKAKYQEIMEESAFWREYANEFDLVALE